MTIDLLLNIKRWWDPLQKREKCLVTAATSVVLYTFVYYALWSPLANSIHRSQQAITQQQSILPWMHQAVSQIKQFEKQESPRLRNSSLASLVENSLKEHSLYNHVEQLRQIQNEQVTIKFGDVPFDKLLLWVTLMWEKNAVTVEQINVAAEKKSGMHSLSGLVSATVVVSG